MRIHLIVNVSWVVQYKNKNKKSCEVLSMMEKIYDGV